MRKGIATCGRERCTGRDQTRADGRHCHAHRARRLHPTHPGDFPMNHPLLAIPEAYHRGEHLGITSVCSAHPVVIEAALQLAKRHGQACPDRGDLQPGQPRRRLYRHDAHCVPAICRRHRDKVGLDNCKIVLGGDHLGPNPWKDLPADQAMAKAEAMIAAYVQAGFTKLHLDTSMGCRGERVALADAETAERAARLAEIAEMNKVTSRRSTSSELRFRSLAVPHTHSITSM